MKMIFEIFLGTVRRLKIGYIVAVLCAVISFGIYAVFFTSGSAEVDDGSSPVCAAVIYGEDSALTKEFSAYLTDRLGFEQITDGRENFNNMLINKDISTIIEIPEGLQQSLLDGKDVKIKSVTLDDYENAAYISAYLDVFMQSMDTAAKASGGDKEKFESMIGSAAYSSVNIELAEMKKSGNDIGSFSPVPITLGFVQLLATSAMLFITMGVLDDKQYGTYRRMRCSSVKPLHYIAGTGTAAFLQSLICVLPMSVWAIIIGAPNAMETLFGNILFALFLSGMGILVALLVNSKSALFTLSGFLASIGTVAGGSFFPIPENAGMIRAISIIMPYYWLNDISKCTAQYPLVNICILALFAVLVYLAVAVLFSKRNNV